MTAWLCRWCDSLTALPESLGQAQRLSSVHLMNCSRLAALPASFGDLTGKQCSCTARMCMRGAFT